MLCQIPFVSGVVGMKATRYLIGFLSFYSYRWFFANFHIYHQHVRFGLEHTWRIPLIHKHISASTIDHHSFIRSQDLEYCNTGFALGLSFQNFPLNGCFVKKLLFFINPILNACFILWLMVHHSRLSSSLLSFIQSIWLTCGRLKGLSMNVIAFNLCNRWSLWIQFFTNFNLMYHLPTWSFIILHFLIVP